MKKPRRPSAGMEAAEYRGHEPKAIGCAVGVEHSGEISGSIQEVAKGARHDNDARAAFL